MSIIHYDKYGKPTAIQRTYMIRQVFAKTGIADNTATGVFKINTPASGDQGGGYSCIVCAVVGHGLSASGGSEASKSFLAHFAHANDKDTDVATSAIVEISESAVAAMHSAVRSIDAVTMTAVENGLDEVQVKFTIDLTGSAVATAEVICQVELAWYAYASVPTMTLM